MCCNFSHGRDVFYNLQVPKSHLKKAEEAEARTLIRGFCAVVELQDPSGCPITYLGKLPTFLPSIVSFSIANVLILFSD
jgi:hypothetical protein